VTAEEAWAIARRRLIEDLGCEIADPVSFVDDVVVEYAVPDRISVSRGDLFGLDDDERWQPYLSPRPTWLHFNLLTVERQPHVVTIRRSPDSMAAGDRRATPVNVSAEPVPARVDDGSVG